MLLCPRQHRCLGHLAFKVFNSIIRDCKVPVKASEVFSFFESCQYGKSHALHFPLFTSRVLAWFELIHTDLWGLASVLSIEGFHYYVLLIADYNRFTCIYPLKLKSDTLVAVTHFMNMVTTQFNSSIKALQSYNGGEYTRVHKMCVVRWELSPDIHVHILQHNIDGSRKKIVM